MNDVLPVEYWPIIKIMEPRAELHLYYGLPKETDGENQAFKDPKHTLKLFPLLRLGTTLTENRFESVAPAYLSRQLQKWIQQWVFLISHLSC
jgi:hypothetical protein